MALDESPVRPSSAREGGAVVIVDPDSAHADALADAVKALGHAVTIAASAAEALSSIEREAPDVLVVAASLPDVDGQEVARRAGLLSAPPEVVLVADQATPEASLVALEVDAAGVLVKPVNAARAGGLIGRLVDRRRRRHEQEEFTEKLRTLSALSGLITSARDTQEVFKALARAATMLLGARLVHVWVDDPRAQVLRVRGTYGLDPEFERPLTEYEVIPYGSGMAGGTFALGRPEFIFGVRTNPRWKNRRLAEAAGLHAYAGLPLMAGDRTLGVLAIVFGERGAFSVEEKELMQRLADHAAFTIVRAEAREQAERDRARLEVLYAVSRRLAAVHDVDGVLNAVVNEAARLLGLEAAGIRLLEGEQLVIAARTDAAAQLMTKPTLRVGESLSGRVVASGPPVIVEDIEHENATVQDPDQRQAALRVGYHAYLGVPLKVGGRAVGVLSVWGRAARSFAPDDVALLSAFADQAAVAFEEARLYAETREREREATNLARVTAHLASSLELHRVLDLITWSAKELLRCDAAAVWRYDDSRDGLVAYRDADRACGPRGGQARAGAGREGPQGTEAAVDAPAHPPAGRRRARRLGDGDRPRPAGGAGRAHRQR
jgi:GAF domain-containing protein/AmiR/NasT family two-component response regulator